jgi:hypothetical protein
VPYQDEADVLGDRVAIMSHGKLRCVGSPLWLKARFGIGYLLSISTIDKAAEEEATRADRGGTIQEAIIRMVPTAEFVSEVARDLSFRLPRSAAPEFSALLDSLQADARVEAFGLSVTTLEEVFIRIAEEDSRESEESAVTDPSVTLPLHGGGSTTSLVKDLIKDSGGEDADLIKARGGGAATCEETNEYHQSFHQPVVPSPTQTRVQPLDVTDSDILAPPPRQLSTSEEVVVHIRKRLVIFQRDKGAFFQMVIPVILIAIILGILTVEVAVSFP